MKSRPKPENKISNSPQYSDVSDYKMYERFGHPEISQKNRENISFWKKRKYPIELSPEWLCKKGMENSLRNFWEILRIYFDNLDGIDPQMK